MTDKMDRASSDAAKSASDPSKDSDASSGKRPHATIDLKAVEVKGTGLAAPAMPPAGDKAEAPKQAGPQAEGTKASEPKPSGKSGGPATSLPPQAMTSKPRLVTHLLSGLAGGAIVLFGADRIAPLLGLPVPNAAMQQTATELQNRLTAIEASVKASTKPSSQLAELSSRLEKLDQTADSVKSLEAAQAALAADTKAAADAVRAATSENAAERLAKLETQLSTLAAAAGTEGDKGGRIQGLAAVTGKVSDLEAGFNTKLNEVRRGLIVDLEVRLAAISEASEKARTGTERLDRELGGIKTEAARLDQGLEVQKSETERVAATMQAVQEDSAKLTSALNGLKGAVDKQLSSVARPADVASAVSPVSEKLAVLENSLAAVIKSEDERKVSAERIVVTLELANLKRALERGHSYAKELADVRKASDGKVDLAVLDRYKDAGVKTLLDLQREMGPLISAAIDADTASMEGSVMERLLAGAKSAVRVRKVSHEAGDKSAEAVMARMEAALKNGQLADLLALARDLPSKSAAPVDDWLANVEARHAVDTAIASVETGLKASLTGKSVAADHPAAATSN